MPTILSRRRSVYRVGIHHLKVTVSNMSYHVLGLCGALDTVSFLVILVQEVAFMSCDYVTYVTQSHFKTSRDSFDVSCDCFFFPAPGPPARVRFTNVGTVLVTIAWDPPVYPRGIITEYKALCRLNASSSTVVWRDDSIDSTVRRQTVGPLNSQTFYRCFVWAKTKQGWSKTPAEAVVFTGGSTGE